MLTTLTKGLLLAALAIGFSAPARAEPCERVVAAELERLRIGPERVANIVYQRRIRTSRNRVHVVGYEAWVDLAECRGSLVVDLSRRCRVRPVYTRGECRLPGVPAY